VEGVNRRYWLFAAVVGALLGATALPLDGVVQADAPTCSATTPELDSMARRELVFVSNDGRRVTVAARVAREPTQLRAGFQHICPATIDRTAILFIFPVAVRTRFHMRNVHGALDIAFIDADGAVVDVVRMEPYGADPDSARPVYGTSSAFQYALEAAPGFFDSRGIAPGKSRMLLE
jgi:uncharacterized membrane protein (UPF0127 family)